MQVLTNRVLELELAAPHEVQAGCSLAELSSLLALTLTTEDELGYVPNSDRAVAQCLHATLELYDSERKSTATLQATVTVSTGSEATGGPADAPDAQAPAPRLQLNFAPTPDVAALNLAGHLVVTVAYTEKRDGAQAHTALCLAVLGLGTLALVPSPPHPSQCVTPAASL